MGTDLKEIAVALHAAAEYLAGRCDHAATLDGAGFSGADAEFGHSLAGRPPGSWSPKQTVAAHKMLAKYRGQLSEGGIEYAAITAPPAADDAAWGVAAEAALTIAYNADARRIEISFPYDKALVAKVREIPGRRWDGTKRFWACPTDPSALGGVARFAESAGAELDPELAALVAEAPNVEPEPERTMRRSEDGERVEVRFAYDPELVREVKALIGRRWDNEGRYWTVPANGNLPDVIAFARDHEFDLEQGLAEEAEAVRAEREAALAASRASDAELELPAEVTREPYPFQRAGVRYAVEKRRTFIADDMGLGKTIQALLALELAEAYPAVIVVPASLKINWLREIEATLPHRTAVALSGRNPIDLDPCDIYVINYDVLGAPRTEGDDGPPTWTEHLLGEAPRALVLDESHYAKNHKAARTKAAQGLSKSTTMEMVLLLTGTPVLNRPAELISQLQILDRLDEFGGFWAFARRYCQATRTRYGMDMSGASNLDELNTRLRETCMVRRLKKDVLKELPPKVRSTVHLEIDNRAAYRRAEHDLVAWVGEQVAADKAARAEVREQAEGEYDGGSEGRAEWIRRRAATLLANRRTAAQASAQRAEHLVRIERLKKLAADGKMAAATDWIETFLESSDEKLVVFATHRDVVRRVAERFGAPVVDGATSQEERQAAVDAFQQDEATRLIVGNLKAMGVGLTLTAASNVAFLELGWTPADHDQAEDRCHRIGQEADSMTAWYLTADNTIEGDIAALIERKRAVVSATADGDPDGTKTAVLDELMAALEARAGKGQG